MRVIKKDGTLEAFDTQKIVNAVSKSAARAMIDLTESQHREIVSGVLSIIESKHLEDIPVPEMHNIVEKVLDDFNPAIAKSYRDYRNYKVDFVHMMDKVYQKSRSIHFIGDKENSNSDSALVATKRCLTFNELNKRLYRKFFMTTDELQACNDGYIYIHDQAARLDTMNCCLCDIATVMTGGFEMGNVWYNEPKSLDVAFDVLGDIILATASQQYGGFTVPEVDRLMVPYAAKSFQKYFEDYISIVHNGDFTRYTADDDEPAIKYAMGKVEREFEQGFQGIEMKLNTVGSSRGDYPFITMTFGLDTSEFGKMAAKTFLRVHMNGQGRPGNKKPVLFPKLVFLYDENLHGVDWKYYGDHYREFLPHISNNDDFAILLSEILGELNASHTGGRYSGTGPSMPTANLGAFFNPNYKGDGVEVTEAVAGGPLSSKKADVRPGDIILAIDGEKIAAGMDFSHLLEGKADRRTRLEIRRKASGKTDTVSVRPITAGELSELLYSRWVERNEAYVDSISGGRIGYVHVRGMNTPSFNAVYDRLLGKYRNCDAVVVDTRWNGGVWLHNDLAVLLSGKEYVRFTPRGRYIGSEPFSQWHKPSVMLVSEANYSDAHGSPYTYKTLEIGKLVGAPVPGTMTAVWWETQIDPSIIFGIPQVTNSDLNGNALENKQLNPDITVYNDPADELSGKDAQLEAAVKALMK